MSESLWLLVLLQLLLENAIRYKNLYLKLLLSLGFSSTKPSKLNLNGSISALKGLIMKKVKYLSASALAVLTLGFCSSIAHADIQTDVINEKWGKPTLVYGVSLTDAQIIATNEAFGIKDIANVNRQITTIDDYNKFMGTTGETPTLISSALVQKADKGNGVKVNIKTPQNITKVTVLQYQNAAITSGASDVNIDIASPVPVTGESALVGVTKALEANGQEVDPKRAEVANQELATAADIAEQNKNNDKFDSAALDLALAQIKTDLAKYKESKGKTADNAEVEKIVNKALKDKGLDKFITADQVQQLVSFANAYQNTSAIDSKEVKEQLENYAKTAYDSLSDQYKKFVSSDEAKGMWEGVKSFFGNLFNYIAGLFSGN